MARWIRNIIILFAVMLFSITTVMLYFRMQPYLVQKKFLASQNYKSLIEYSNGKELPDSYYEVSNLRNPREKTMFADAFMEKDIQYSSLSPLTASGVDSLEPSQVLISRNLAKTFGYSIGETISFRSAQTDEYEEYEIVGLLPSAYGLLAEQFDTRYGIVVFGYDESLMKDNSISSVVFCDDSFSSSQNSLEIKGVLNRNQQLSYCNDGIHAMMVRSCVVLGIINICVYAACYILGNSRLRQKAKLGSSPRQINSYLFENYVSVALIPCVLIYGVFFFVVSIKAGLDSILIYPFLLCLGEIGFLSIIYRFLVRRMY